MTHTLRPRQSVEDGQCTALPIPRGDDAKAYSMSLFSNSKAATADAMEVDTTTAQPFGYNPASETNTDRSRNDDIKTSDLEEEEEVEEEGGDDDDKKSLTSKRPYAHPFVRNKNTHANGPSHNDRSSRVKRTHRCTPTNPEQRLDNVWPDRQDVEEEGRALQATPTISTPSANARYEERSARNVRLLREHTHPKEETCVRSVDDDEDSDKRVRSTRRVNGGESKAGIGGVWPCMVPLLHVVILSAQWADACQSYVPVAVQFFRAHPRFGPDRVAVVDVDRNRTACDYYGIIGVPCVLFRIQTVGTCTTRPSRSLRPIELPRSRLTGWCQPHVLQAHVQRVLDWFDVHVASQTYSPFDSVERVRERERERERERRLCLDADT